MIRLENFNVVSGEIGLQSNKRIWNLLWNLRQSQLEVYFISNSNSRLISEWISLMKSTRLQNIIEIIWKPNSYEKTIRSLPKLFFLLANNVALCEKKLSPANNVKKIKIVMKCIWSKGNCKTRQKHKGLFFIHHMFLGKQNKTNKNPIPKLIT